MLSRILTVALLALPFAGRGQDVWSAPVTPPAPPLPAIAPLAAIPGMPGDDVLMFVSTELGGHSVVKGAPYSATAVNETRQTLADGNRIVRSTSIRLYRDAQGRTRQEQGKHIVFINDVIAGKRLLLNAERKTARELPRRPRALPPTPPAPPPSAVPGAPPAPPSPPAPPLAMSSDEAKTWSESMRQWAREFSSRVRGEPASVERDLNVVIRRGGDGTASGQPEIVNERIEVIRLGDARAPLPPGVPMLPPPGPGTRTALGSRDFDGVRADGTRTTWTIAAGQIGNEKPIEIVSERWYSPELMLVVYSRHADPRSGERIYWLEGIRRDEPPAEMFRVPSDYDLRATATAPKSGPN